MKYIYKYICMYSRKTEIYIYMFFIKKQKPNVRGVDKLNIGEHKINT